MATKVNEMLEFCSEFIAGYFYTYGYNALAKNGSDSNPIIYCVFAPKTSNLITGINLHYFDDATKLTILKNMHSTQFICNDDIPHVFNGSQLNKVYSNIAYGLREYNKTRMSGVYRIKNKYVPEFLHLPSDFFMSNDLEKQIQKALEISKNKGF